MTEDVMTPVRIFELLSGYVKTNEGKVLYILGMICLLMAIDFVLGTLSAWRNPNIEMTSKEGINGILRKVASIIVLIICIPLSVLIPGGAGIITLYVLYLGYLIMEFHSIVENLNKLGVNILPLKVFAAKLGANAGNISRTLTTDKEKESNDEYISKLSNIIESEVNNILEDKLSEINKTNEVIRSDKEDIIMINTKENTKNTTKSILLDKDKENVSKESKDTNTKENDKSCNTSMKDYLNRLK